MKKSIEYYLQRVGAKSLEDLDFKQLQKMFLFSIKFFIQKEISLDDLSNISSVIWPIPLEKDSKEEIGLKNAIHSCAEINFYIRQISESDKDGQATLSYLLETFNYYHENKIIIE